MARPASPPTTHRPEHAAPEPATGDQRLERHRRALRDASVGELLSQVTADMQQLFRQEVQLAKTELREEATRAGKAAGMFGGAGFSGYMVAVFGSFAVLFALGNVMNLGWAALVVTLLWAVAAAVLALLGRGELRKVHGNPMEQAMETVKEDARWARHPRTSGQTSNTPGRG